LDRFSNILKQRLDAMQSAEAAHPSSNALIAFVEQALTSAQHETVLAHLSVCPECRQAVALATPEAAVASAEKASVGRASIFEFPMAMRWAGLAVGLAVVVGVGVIAYEREAGSNPHATLKLAQEKAPNPPVNPEPGVKENKTTDKPELNDRSSAPAVQLHSTIAQKQELRRDRATKSAPLAGAMPGALSTSAPFVGSKDEYDARAKALPPAPEAQFALKRDRASVVQEASAAPAPPPSTSVTADANVAQESGGVVAGNPSGKPYGETSEVAGSANSASTHTQFVPAKALNAAATPGSVAKTKRAYGMLGFVHWTISAAGKLQRRALDGTLTVVEPLSGAIIRAVAAEGIEVWAAGLQFAPTPKNVQPRSLLFHSSDAGESWKTIDGPWQGSIERVNLAGLGSLTVVTTDGTWSTGDGGKSWNRP